ncbi:MAG: hypothetical protein FVQ78_09515 [Solirubrobacterales bacterium]|nr:hypothetical protein [Solirubrobacterales bacterium]
MAGDAKQKARAEVRRAQSKFERAQGQLEEIGDARRESFERAKAAGLSMRDIGKEAGLHFTRVAQILRKK